MLTTTELVRELIENMDSKHCSFTDGFIKSICVFFTTAGLYDSILRAQRLKAADDIQFVERGSEHFFEGEKAVHVILAMS